MPAAQKDLNSIWDLTEKHWDARQAEEQVRRKYKVPEERNQNYQRSGWVH